MVKGLFKEIPLGGAVAALFHGVVATSYYHSTFKARQLSIES